MRERSDERPGRWATGGSERVRGRAAGRPALAWNGRTWRRLLAGAAPLALALAFAACDGTAVAPSESAVQRYVVPIDTVALVQRSQGAVVAEVTYRLAACDDSARVETGQRSDTLLLAATARRVPWCTIAGTYLEQVTAPMRLDSSAIIHVLARQPDGTARRFDFPGIPADSASLSIGLQGNVALLRPALTVTARSGAFSQTWRGADIASPQAPNYAARVATPLHGTLTVQVQIASADGGLAAEGQLELELQPDRILGVTVWLSGRNPMDGCFGCLGMRAFTVPPSFQQTPRDSLYLVWGQNSIKHPWIY